MPDANAARESNESRGLVRYVDPNNPTGPMLTRLPITQEPSKPKPRRPQRRTTKKKT